MRSRFVYVTTLKGSSFWIHTSFLTETELASVVISYELLEGQLLVHEKSTLALDGEIDEAQFESLWDKALLGAKPSNMSDLAPTAEESNTRTVIIAVALSIFALLSLLVLLRLQHQRRRQNLALNRLKDNLIEAIAKSRDVFGEMHKNLCQASLEIIDRQAVV